MNPNKPDSGYGIVMRAAMRSNAVSCGAKAVYAYLCAFSGYEGTCYPSQSLIAHELNLNVCTVRKYINELTANNYITADRVRSDTGKYERTTYGINFNYNGFTMHGASDGGETVHGSAIDGETDTNINNINNNKYNNHNYNINNDIIPDTCMRRTSPEECRLIEEQFMKRYTEV